MRGLAPALTTFLLAHAQSDCCLTRLAWFKNLQTGFVSFSLKVDGIRNTGVRLQANGLAVGRRIDDALREACVESLRQRSTGCWVGKFRSEHAVGIWLQGCESRVELMIGQPNAGGQVLFCGDRLYLSRWNHAVEFPELVYWRGHDRVRSGADFG